MASDSKNWASEYILDPINGPDPSQETGLNASFKPDRTDSAATETVAPKVAKQSTGASSVSSTNPFRDRANSSAKSSSIVHSRAVSHASNGPDPFQETGLNASATTETSAPRVVKHSTGASSASSSTNPFRDPARSSARSSSVKHSRVASGASNGSPSYRTDAFPDLDGFPTRRSGEASRSAQRRSGEVNRSRRSSSLRERYPGDPSVHPLDQITRENKVANRSPHLKKQHLNGPDTIDKLDDIGPGGKYHHEGPYDAASFARNNSFETAPIEALRSTNEEAIRATPDDKLRDSLNDHRPLEGTAMFPPGTTDPLGRSYDYEEGTDMMREGRPEGGPYKRYPGVDYLPEDLKGKGEPSYSKDKLEKEQKIGRKPVNGAQGIELVDRPRSNTNGSTGSRISGEIRRRVGSLKKKDK